MAGHKNQACRLVCKDHDAKRALRAALTARMVEAGYLDGSDLVVDHVRDVVAGMWIFNSDNIDRMQDVALGVVGVVVEIEEVKMMATKRGGK